MYYKSALWSPTKRATISFRANQGPESHYHAILCRADIHFFSISLDVSDTNKRQAPGQALTKLKNGETLTSTVCRRHLKTYKLFYVFQFNEDYCTQSSLQFHLSVNCRIRVFISLVIQSKSCI